MELVRIPIQELDKVWPILDKDIRDALAYSSQLNDSNFVYETAKQGKFQVWVLWIMLKNKLTKNILVL